MKGVILNVVEEVVVDGFGEQVWEQLLATIGSDGVFTALGTYDDAILSDLVAAAAAVLDVSEADVLRHVGRQGYTLLAGRYPRLTERYASSRDLLGDLDKVIHPQVLAVSPGARPPAFEAEQTGTRLRLAYSSARRLCHLAEGLAAGAVHEFGEEASVSQPTCVLRGDATCVIVVDYVSGG